MRKINDTVNHAFVTARMKGNMALRRVTGILRRNEGEGFVDTALKILISVVVGALLLAGLYALLDGALARCWSPLASLTALW